MDRRSGFAYWVFMILLAVLALSSFAQFRFLSRAVRTEGEVTRVEAANYTCSDGGKRRRRYPCTRFTGVVRFFTADGAKYGLTVTAGELRGHDRDVGEARLHAGQAYRVIYDSKQPETAYPDTFFGLWKDQVVIATIAFIFLIMSLARRGRRFS